MMSRYLAVLLAVAWVGTSLHQVRADKLTLVGEGPTGTAYLTDTSLGGYSGWNFYAGLLKWNDSTNSSTVYTYCIDVAGVISNNYSAVFTPEPVSTLFNSLFGPGTQATDVANAVENLALLDPVDANTQNGAPGPNQISAPAAETFQIALWDIITNWSDGNRLAASGVYYAPTQLALSFQNPNLGQSVITNGLALAASAYAQPAPSSDHLMAFVPNIPGQNQAFYIGSGSSLSTTNTPLPLPLSAAGGLALFGVFGAVHWSRRGKGRRVA